MILFLKKDKKINRKVLVSHILNEFEKLYIPFKDKGDGSKAIEICRRNSALIGKEVRIIRGEETRLGKALNINDDGELMVEFDDGSLENVFSGELSIRGLKGYI